MPKNSTVGIFLAAAAALSTTAIIPDHSIAGDNHLPKHKTPFC